MEAWLVLSLLSAFTLASSDAATKHWLANVPTSESTLVRLGLAGLLLLPFAIRPELLTLPLDFWLWVALLAPLEITAMWLYIHAIQRYPLSLTVPYLAFTPVFVTLTGLLILDEAVDSLGFMGILLVVIGSWLLNLDDLPNWNPRSLLAPFQAIFRNPGSRIMLLVATIYSITAAGGKKALDWLEPAHFGPLYYSVVGGLALVLLISRRPAVVGVVKRHPVHSLVVAGLMAIMVVTHFFAISMVEAAYMIAVKRTSLLFGVLYGVYFFGEQHALRHIVSAGIMLAGVVLIAI